MSGDTAQRRKPDFECPGLDLARLRGFLDQRCPGLVGGPLFARLIEGGRSNITYVIGDGAGGWVLRRPPLGHVLPTAHDMAREFRFLQAVRSTRVAVPPTVIMCGDAAVIGAPFYLMDFVAGHAYQSAAELAALGPLRTRAIAEALVDTLVTLHQLDPHEVGLADIGRPAGFLERQLRRWHAQLEASAGRDVRGSDTLHHTLEVVLPAAGPSALVHGDYRLENVLVAADDGVAAVLDWEMATVGDPPTDLGLLIAYPAATREGVFPDGVAAAPGYPDTAELAARYTRAGGRDLSALRWYVAFACYKLAVIARASICATRVGRPWGRDLSRSGLPWARWSSWASTPSRRVDGLRLRRHHRGPAGQADGLHGRTRRHRRGRDRP
jgi:aminoglycoside phosphotransferase (APT) family kinase protein